MKISVDLLWLAITLLVAIRLGALFILTPVFASVKLPPQFRLMLIVGFSIALVAALPAKLPNISLDMGSLFLAAVAELALGALLAFGLFTGFGVFMMAGELIDIQIGFSVANIFDPITRAQSPLLGMIFNLTAVMLFFSIDGHHMLLRGVAFSLEKMPPGSFFTQFDPAALVAQFGAMFVMALTFAAPVVFILLLVDIGLGVMSRTMPQINIFVVGIPVKIVVGFMVLISSATYLGPVMKRVFESIFLYWQRLFI
jgi:flagellar biosynthesis protein FliR